MREQMRMVSPETIDKQFTSAMPSVDNRSQTGGSGSTLDLQKPLNDEPESSLRKRLADSTQSRPNFETKPLKKRKLGRDKSHNMVLSWAFSEILTGVSQLSHYLDIKILCVS
jgi:hypothetical protein